MKKRLIEVLLLLICIVFTGCGNGWTDTYEIGRIRYLKTIHIGYDYATVSATVENVDDLDDKGICYAEHSNPTISDHNIANANLERCEIRNLKQGTTYYWRVYVQKEDVIVYSDVQNFTTKKGYSQVRFKKMQNYEYVTRLAVSTSTSQESHVVDHYFGTNAGISSYNSISSGNYYIAYYYLKPGEIGWRYPSTYDFRPDRRYTVTCDDDGTYLTFYVVDEGTKSESGTQTDTIRIAKSYILHKAFVNE